MPLIPVSSYLTPTAVANRCTVVEGTGESATSLSIILPAILVLQGPVRGLPFLPLPIAHQRA